MFYDSVVVIESITYHAMMMANAFIPKRSNKGMHERRKIYFILFPFHPQFLNFKANNGISAMSSQLLRAIMARIIISAHLLDSIMGAQPITKDPQNNALAGVGSPMKDVVCLSSRLNFANRSAENAATMNAR